VWHLLDVGACAGRLLATRPLARGRFATALGISESDAVRLAILLAALHDLGKFAAAFQQKAEGPEWPFARARDSLFGRSEHDRDGLMLWRQQLVGKFGLRIWPGAENTLNQLIGASVGHHGRAVMVGSSSPIETFQAEGIAAASACVVELCELLMPSSIDARAPSDRALAAISFWFAGFITISDWAGSGQQYFRYEAPDMSISAYWALAQARAITAIRALGLESAPRSGPKTFTALTAQLTPTPLQTLAESVDLGQGPALIVIEDATGAGKTEAAQLLVHRLMSSGRAAGAYWAMPTQATANAMYERQRQALSALFADGARPQLALAHGGAQFHPGFQNSILRGSADAENPFGDAYPDETASAACAAFLAEDARTSLIADVGAGTIDQAILGVLPTRFQAVRLFGLSDKVLVIDEAHAYDAYMSEELKSLLQFHAAMGGSAVVLSATLPHDVNTKAGRTQLVRAWMEGCGVRMRDWVGRPVLQCTDYPLVTVVCGRSPAREYPVAAASWSKRSVPVRIVDQDDMVIEALITAAREGAAVAWVRNTVDDTLEAAARMRGRGIDPVIFHARFAQIDRQRIERSVMDRFGPLASAERRRGAIVIATQVIEQSLDIDFDLMASDLAPIDLLIQRAGRLRRHPQRAATRPDVPFELIIRAPPYLEDPPANWIEGSMRRTSFVYTDPAVLWRTLRELRARGEIAVPGDMRDLIEAVYASDAHIPPGLDPKAMKAEGVAKAHGGQARQALLSVVQGYRAEQMAWVSEDRVQVQTRLGTVQTTLRLARLDADGGLAPWAQDGQRWSRWALSEVKMAAHRAPPRSKPLVEWEPAARAARTEWGARERGRDDFLLLPLERHRDHWRGALNDEEGTPYKFIYREDSGLEVA
jgi:CRISPR-associated endonuclease/helicase Cas3